MVQKSCSSWDVYNPINNGIFTISTGDHRISPINSSTWTFFSRFFLPVQHRFVCSRRRFRGCVWLVILYLFFYDGKNHHCSPPIWEYFWLIICFQVFSKSKCFLYFLSSSHDWLIPDEGKYTRWWFQIFFNVHPYLGKIPMLTNTFSQMDWNNQLANDDSTWFNRNYENS